MRKQSDSTGKNASASNASSLTGNDPPKAGYVQAQIRKKKSPGKSKQGQAKYKDVMPFTKKYQKGKSVFHDEDETTTDKHREANLRNLQYNYKAHRQFRKKGPMFGTYADP